MTTIRNISMRYTVTIKIIATILAGVSMTFAGCFNFNSILPYLIMVMLWGLWEEDNVYQCYLHKNIVKISGIFFLLFFISMTVVTGIKSGLFIYQHIFRIVFSIAGAGIIYYIVIRTLHNVIRKKIEKKIEITSICLTTLILFMFRYEGLISDKLVYEKILGALLTGFIIYLCLINLEGKKIEKELIVKSALFAFIYVIGNISVFVGLKNRSHFLILLAGIVILFLFLYTIFFYLSAMKIRNLIRKLSDRKCEKSSVALNKKHFIFIWLFSVFCQLVYLGVYYPGILSPDSINQMGQVLGEYSFSNHHPWLHTIIIKLFFNIGKNLMGSNEAGVAFYSLFSIFFMSFCYVVCIHYLYKKGMSKNGFLFIILFFALDPIKCLFAITMWKDVLFSGVVLLFAIQICELCDCKTNNHISVFFWCGFIVIGILVCLLRSNGFYAFLLFIPFLLYCSSGKRKESIIVTLFILLSVFIFKGPIMMHFQVKEPDLIESLSVPAQQIAYTVKDGKILDEEMSLLNEIIDTDKVAETYVDWISDPIKNLVRQKENQDYLKSHWKDYLCLYIKIGMRNPFDYLDAWVRQTKGYYYHKVNYAVIEPTVSENNWDIEAQNILPASVKSLVDLIRKSFFNYIYHEFFSIGFFTNLFIILFLTALRGDKKCWLPFIPIIGILLTLLMATPVYAEFRYAYPVYLCLPLFIGKVLHGGKTDLSGG